MTNTQRSLVSGVGGAIATVVVLLGGAALMGRDDRSNDNRSADGASTSTTAKSTTTTVPPITSSTSSPSTTSAPSTTTTTEVPLPAIAPAPPAPRMPRTAAAVVDNSVVLIDTRSGESSTLVAYPEPNYPEPSDTVRTVALGPDGVVYFALDHYEGGGDYTHAIWFVSEGTEPALVVEGGHSPSLSRDGQRLAYAIEPEEEQYLIAVRDLETGDEQSWTFPEGTAAAYLVPQGWAPDGKRLAYHFSTGEYGPSSIGILDTRRDSELSPDPALYGPAYNVLWLDNDRLLYDGGATGLLLAHELSSARDTVLVDFRDGLGTPINWLASVSLDTSGRWILVTASLPAEEYSENFTTIVYGPTGGEASFETLPFTVGYGGAAWR